MCVCVSRGHRRACEADLQSGWCVLLPVSSQQPRKIHRVHHLGGYAHPKEVSSALRVCYKELPQHITSSDLNWLYPPGSEQFWSWLVLCLSRSVWINLFSVVFLVMGFHLPNVLAAIVVEIGAHFRSSWLQDGLRSRQLEHNTQAIVYKN